MATGFVRAPLSSIISRLMYIAIINLILVHSLLCRSILFIFKEIMLFIKWPKICHEKLSNVQNWQIHFSRKIKCCFCFCYRRHNFFTTSISNGLSYCLHTVSSNFLILPKSCCFSPINVTINQKYNFLPKQSII